MPLEPEGDWLAQRGRVGVKASQRAGCLWVPAPDWPALLRQVQAQIGANLRAARTRSGCSAELVADRLVEVGCNRNL